MKAWKSSGDSQIAGYYDLQETIGRGHFAVVKRARHVFTGEVVATKVVDKTKLDEVARQHLYHEVRCMKLVQHPYVVRLYEVIDTKNKLYLIQEFGDGGDLFDYIVKRENGLGEELARKYFRQIVSAVAFCHRLHVVHRDLKPENVIFFPKLDVVKVTDFGFSNSFIPGDKLNTACGSLAYSAPEVLLGDAYDAVASDIWSLGVILYMLVVGRLPFSEANDSETLTKIMDCQYKIPNSLSIECQRLLRKLLIKEPSERLSVDNILIDEWFGNAINEDHIVGVHPLLSRGELSEEEKEHVISIMVSGNVATREEILNSLEEKTYNHLEATFYLLAERHLNAMLAARLGRFASIPSVRTYPTNTISGSTGRPSSGSDILTSCDASSSSTTRKSAEAMTAISEAEVTLEEENGVEEEQEQEEEARRFSVLIEEPFEDPDELPQIYEIREGVDDLEVECRKASLTRLANIAEMSESDDAVSSGGRPSGRLSVGGVPSDSGPEQEGANLQELGSPSVKARSARSSWIGTGRRSSGGNQLRSGSVSNRPQSLSRSSVPLSVSPFCRLTRSASSSDTSDIESDAMSMSMNRSMARMKREAAYAKHTPCVRCDLDFPRSLAASLLLSVNEPHNRHRRPPRHRRHVVNRQGGTVESSEAATTSASDTEQPFSSATSRCQSAAASVTFILGAVANEQQSQGQQTPVIQPADIRRSSLPQTEVASIRACCMHALEARTYFAPPVLQRVPFDQQQLPRSYRHALQMRLRHNHQHGSHRHKRFSATSDVPLPPSHLLLAGRHSANPGEVPANKEKLRARNSVPPRIDEVSLIVPSPDKSKTASPVENDNVYDADDSTPLISAANRSIPQKIENKVITTADIPINSTLQENNNDSQSTNKNQQNSRPLMGHASAPGTAVLSGVSATSNRRHPTTTQTCDMRPLNQLQLIKAQRMSEFSVSTTSRGTGSECSLPASSAPSIQNGFKTPSVSSVRSDPDLFHYRNTGLPLHCDSTASAVVGGSCRSSRGQKRSGDEDCEALLGANSPQNNNNSNQHYSNDVPNSSKTNAMCARCGSIHSSSNNASRKRGSSSSYRSGGNHCRGQSSSGRTGSIQGPEPSASSGLNGILLPEMNGNGTTTTATTTVANRHNKRNLLRSLFGQCFGCSLGNNVNSTRKLRARRERNTSSNNNNNNNNRKKIDSSGLS